MTSYCIDGKLLANELCEQVKFRIDELQKLSGKTPGLAVVRVGDDPASEVYVGKKIAKAKSLGVHSEAVILPANSSQSEVASAISKLVASDKIHGILLQLPLPSHIDAMPLIESIPVDYDVDGFTSASVAALAQSRRGLVACTPMGCMLLARKAVAKLSDQDDDIFGLDKVSLAGKKAVVLGRSQIVGRPLAQLLVNADCTVTIAHSRTKDIAHECRQADLLFLAVGKPEMVPGSWIKPGAIVIDVGINRIFDAEKAKNRLVGDGDTKSISAVAGAYTPVPGGVGPMTIAYLMSNTVAACAMQLEMYDSVFE